VNYVDAARNQRTNSGSVGRLPYMSDAARKILEDARCTA
jgi:hypothetical protein